MKALLFALAGGAAACVGTIAMLGACASDETTAAAESHDVVPPPSLDSGTASDGDADSNDAAEAGACVDCEYSPAECSDGILCPSGPFGQVGSAAIDGRSRVNAIRGRSSSDVWIAGAVGTLLHFDGTSWTRSDPGSKDSMRAIWLRGDSEIAITALHDVHTRNIEINQPGVDAGAASPDGWTSRLAFTAGYDYAKSAMPLTSAWAADDGEWLWCTTRTTSGSGSMGIWRMHYVEANQRFEFAGAMPSGACKALGCSSLTGIHGTSASDLWTVGAFGTALHVTNADGTTPVMQKYNTQTWSALNAVWAADVNDVWAVGDQGVIRHYTGDPLLWDVVADVPTTANLNAVWGSSPSDVWAVGDNAVALHYDGKTWTRVKVAGLDGRWRPDLTAVWTPSAGHVWIGGVGVVLSLGGKP